MMEQILTAVLRKNIVLLDCEEARKKAKEHTACCSL